MTAPDDEPPLGLQLLGWLIVCVGLWSTIAALRPFVFYFLPSLPMVFDAAAGGAFLRVYARSLLGDAAMLALQAAVIVAGVGAIERRAWARAWVVCLSVLCLGGIAREAWIAGGPVDELAQWRAFAASPGWVAAFGLVPSTIPPATALAALALLAVRGRRWLPATPRRAWLHAIASVALLLTIAWWAGD